jgi:hypothetical protein
MKLETVTNVLDLCAFLMVTIDLYGRRRFEELAEKLNNIKLGRFDLARWWRDNWREYVAAIVFGSLGFLVWYLTLVVYSAYTGHKFILHNPEGDFNTLVYCLGWQMWVCFVLILISMWWIFRYSYWVISTASQRMVIYLLKVYPLDGVLVLLGSLIYVLTRLYVIYVSNFR